MIKHLPLLYLTSTASYLRQLYGEWIVLHSNIPIFSSTNSKIVTIFPKKRIVCRTFKTRGPLLNRNEYSGEFLIECLDKDEGCRIDEDNVCDISIMWKKKKSYVESFFGIGLSEISQKIETTPVGDAHNINITLNVLENNNLYLSNDDYHLHLIRNVTPNRPENNIALSSFIATQIFGSILLHFLHTYFQDLL